MTETWTDFFDETAPVWLRGFWGARLVGGVFGVIFDSLRDAAVTAIKSPLISEEIPDDAVIEIGKSSNLERYATESFAAYKQRISERWTLWERGGNHYAILRQLALFGFSSVSLVTPINFAMEPIGYSSHFAIRVPVGGHTFTQAPELGDVGVDLGDPGLKLGIGNISSEEVRGLRALVNKMRPADVICRGYLFQTAITPVLGDTGLDLGDVGLELGSSYAKLGVNGI